ncbi:MAG: hypothetical protein K6E33_09940 [Lachnospiraceae bacterium]|nr:hypothetical protein [Lachnospiraceae bacterium]
MNYTPPKIHSIKIKGKTPLITEAELSTDSMQLPGFLALRTRIEEVPAVRYVSLDAIEEMVIAAEELDKTFPDSYIPEVRIRTRVDHY